METSILLARLFGVTFLGLSLAFLFKTKYYHKIFLKMLKDQVFMFYGGILALFTSVLIVSYHNIWEASWVIIITIFGWMGVFKGIILLLFPKHLTDFTKNLFKKRSFIKITGVGILILGLFLCYYGFESFILDLIGMAIDAH